MGDPDTDIDKVHLDLLPPPGRQLEERTLSPVRIATPLHPRPRRHRPPRFLNSRRGPANVCGDLGRGAERPRVDVRGTPFVAALVLVDHLASQGGLGPTDVAVGIASDVGQNVGNVPAGQQTRTPHGLVGQPFDGIDESPMRVGHSSHVDLGHRHKRQRRPQLVENCAVELEGDRVLLRAVRTSDLDALEVMFAEPDVALWWPRFDRAKIDDELLHPDADTTVYTVTVDGEIAGVIESWVEDDPDYRHAGIDIALATRWHGAGVAVDALRALARHLVQTEGHHRIVIDPAVENRRAIACYRKVGFQPVGVMRRYERGPDGTFHDSLLMDMLASELQ